MEACRDLIYQGALREALKVASGPVGVLYVLGHVLENPVQIFPGGDGVGDGGGYGNGNGSGGGDGWGSGWGDGNGDGFGYGWGDGGGDGNGDGWRVFDGSM